MVWILECCPKRGIWELEATGDVLIFCLSSTGVGFFSYLVNFKGDAFFCVTLLLSLYLVSDKFVEGENEDF